jgi:hypothetical protein
LESEFFWRDLDAALPDVLKGKAPDWSDALLSGKGVDDLSATLKLPWQKSLLQQNKAKIEAVIESHKQQGQLYKTDIPDEAVARFLDWDKPLSQQSKEVQAALDAMGVQKSWQMFNKNGDGIGSMQASTLDDALAQWNATNRANGDYVAASAKPSEFHTGRGLHDTMAGNRGLPGEMGTPKAVADAMRKAGIPGIRYLDGGSRSAGQGSSNFVIFDPEMIRILERNGQATGVNPWSPGEYSGQLIEAIKQRK